MHTRRDILRQMIVGLGGAGALLAFDTGTSFAGVGQSAVGRSTFYSESEVSLLNFLADAIIPRTDTPGALDAGVPALLDRLHREWASASTQALHHRQLQSIARLLASHGESAFSLDAASRRVQALRALDAAAYEQRAGASVLANYRAVKSLIVQGYYSTEAGASLEHHYVAVPGRWIASAPLSEIRKFW